VAAIRPSDLALWAPISGDPLAVAERCRWIDSFLGRSRLPLASLSDRLLARGRHAASPADAERILARAAALATSHGARFRLIFLARPADWTTARHRWATAALLPLSEERDALRPSGQACPACAR
jgi:hypothetical protein